MEILNSKKSPITYTITLKLSEEDLYKLQDARNALINNPGYNVDLEEFLSIVEWACV